VTPNAANTIETNYTRNNSTGVPVAQQVTTLNVADLTQALAPDMNKLNVNLFNLANIPSIDIASAAVTPSPAGVPQNIITSTNDFNYQSLMTPHLYDTSKGEDQNALNFIRFISDYAEPLSAFNLESFLNAQNLTLNQKRQVIQSVQTAPDYQTYIVARRTLAAQQSAALTILYQIYARRLPIPNIKAADTALNRDNPSALQIEDYIANWRTSSPAWYQAMETAPPATIARETLYVLAEIQRQLQSIRMDNERLASMQAINQLAAMGATKTNFKTRVESEAKNYVTSQVNALLNKPTPQPVEQAQSASEAQRLQQTEQQGTTPTPGTTTGGQTTPTRP
jgi:hypothetical protein